MSRRHQMPYAQGWIVADASQIDASNVPGRWRSLTFGGLSMHFDPALEVHHLTNHDSVTDVILLGQATDSAKRLTTSSAVAAELLQVLISTNGWEDFDEAVTWLGGRFVIIAKRDSATRVHVDAMASRSCYWAVIGNQIVLASHSALVAHAVGDLEANGARWVLTNPDYQNPAGKSLPGMVTPHDVANLVIANCALTIEGHEVAHRRFFFHPPDNLSVPEATERYLSELRFQMETALARSSEAVLGLTAGADSRAILAGTLDLLSQADATMMTYHFFSRNADHSRSDLLGANQLSNEYRLVHRILDVSDRKKNTTFQRIYQQTFPTWARFPSLAQTYYEDLNVDTSLMLGIGGEIGTVFYRERDFDQITPEVLAGKFTQSKFQHDPQLIQTMTEYMDYTELNQANSAGYDLLDLFYWEHRLSTWAAYGYSEADFGPLVVLPLNSRRIFHAMLSVPFKDRLRRSVYHQLAAWSGITG